MFFVLISGALFTQGHEKVVGEVEYAGPIKLPDYVHNGLIFSYDDLKLQDKKSAEKLKYNGVNFFYPKQKDLDRMHRLKGFIEKTAKKAGIKNCALAATLLYNQLTYGDEDIAQDKYYRDRFVLGERAQLWEGTVQRVCSIKGCPTIGPNQINVDMAEQIAPKVNKIFPDHFFPKSKEGYRAHAVKRILTTAGALKYSAYLLSRAQTEYKAVHDSKLTDGYRYKADLLIENNPVILAALYNLSSPGNYGSFAKRAIAQKRPPKPEAFGFLVNSLLPDLKKLGYDCP